MKVLKLWEYMNTFDSADLPLEPVEFLELLNPGKLGIAGGLVTVARWLGALAGQRGLKRAGALCRLGLWRRAAVELLLAFGLDAW